MVPITRLELTNINEDRRMELVRHLERMKKAGSRSLMLVQKQDELGHLGISPKEIASAKSLLPTSKELNDFWRSEDAISNVEVIVANGEKKCKKTGIVLSK